MSWLEGCVVVVELVELVGRLVVGGTHGAVTSTLMSSETLLAVHPEPCSWIPNADDSDGSGSDGDCSNGSSSDGGMAMQTLRRPVVGSGVGEEGPSFIDGLKAAGSRAAGGGGGGGGGGEAGGRRGGAGGGPSRDTVLSPKGASALKVSLISVAL